MNRGLYISRRQLLASSAVGIANATLGSRVAGPMARRVPLTSVTRRSAPNHLLPEPPHVDTLRHLAQIAMDAARGADAEFADIRIGVQRFVAISGDIPIVALTVGYGVRARLAGAWGFQYGSILNADAISSAARSAVRGAQRYAATNRVLGHTPMPPLAPVPVVTGEWRSPVVIDPFTVPLDDYYRVIASLRDVSTGARHSHAIQASGMVWEAETRVFASTEGSMVTQHLMRGTVDMTAKAWLPENTYDQVAVDIPHNLGVESGGFEIALRPERMAALRAGMDEAIRLRELPRRSFSDVGRFPVVLGGASWGSVIGTTIGRAVDGDRATGDEADASGGTFLVPPDAVLHADPPLCSPLLSVRVDRTLPSPMAVQWDDDGVVPEPYPIVDGGRIMDYITTRDTAATLSGLRPRGGAVAPTPTSIPVGSGGHLHVSPASTSVSLSDLMRDISHGFLLRDAQADTESGVTLGTISGGLVLEIRRGKPVARTNVLLQFATKAILRNKLVALGDTHSLRTAIVATPKGIPWESIKQIVTAPAVLCKDMDVVSWTFQP